MSTIQSFHDDVVNLQSINLLDYIEVIPEFKVMNDCNHENPHHLEGSILVHTNMAGAEVLKLLDQVPEQNDKVALYLATIIHDIGKPSTKLYKAAKQKHVYYGHDKAGVPLAKDFLFKYFPELSYPVKNTILSLIEHHMEPRMWMKSGIKDKKLQILSLCVNTKLLYLLSIADTLGRKADDMSGCDLLEKFKTECERLNIWDKYYIIPASEQLSNHAYAIARWNILTNGRPETQETLDQAVELTSHLPKFQLLILCGPPGCHAKGTKILMYDGSLKSVEDVKIGDLLMGPDSTNREVLKLCLGKEKMYKISPIKGDSFVVNENHILHLIPSYSERYPLFKNGINLSVKEYVKLSKALRERLKLLHSSVEFPQKSLSIDPYILGLWLGDGDATLPALTTMDQQLKDEWIEYGKQFNLFPHCYKQHGNSKCETVRLSSEIRGFSCRGKNEFLNKLKQLNLIKNKHIPFDYLTSSREQRLQLLAGLTDTDGYVTRNGFMTKGEYGLEYDYITKLEVLADNIIYLCRSLGFAAYKKKVQKSCWVRGNVLFTGDYYRISVSGALDIVPVRLERKKCKKRKMNKDVKRVGFSISEITPDDYYGFILDKDHLYLTGDFTIHHNSGKTTYRENLLKQFPRTQVVSMDEKRLELLGDINDQSANSTMFRICCQELRVAMQKRQNVIYDTTAASKKHRKAIIDIARKQGALVGCVYFDLPLQTLLERNANREKKVPESVVYEYYYKRMERIENFEADKVTVIEK